MKTQRLSLTKKNVIFAYASITPTIAYLGLVVGYPMFYLLWIALNKVTWQTGKLMFEWAGVENFKIILNDVYFLEALKHTIYIVIISVPISFILALVVAICLNRIRFGRNILRTGLLLPWMIAPALASTMWRWLYHDQFGILNYVLYCLGIIKQPVLWLANPEIAINSIVICDVWQYTPFCMIILFAGLQDVPEELYDASKVDGANSFEVFRYITLPCLKSHIVFVLLIRTVFTLRIFDFIFTLTRGGPARSTEVLATYIYKLGFQFMKYDYSSAVSIILLLITIIAIFGYMIIFKVGSEKF